jgi:bifunctional enzyme CysN/CysC
VSPEAASSADSEPFGGVIWLTGFSSAGKTSLGRIVVDKLRESGTPAVFLDGDDLRGVLGNKWGYTDEERRELTRVYFRLCSHLASQGQTVVIAAAAMYKSAFAWYRENVPGGMLVYLDVPEDVRRRRDAAIAKGVYTDAAANAARYDIPTPDLTVANPDGADLGASAERVLSHYRALPRRSADRGRSNHWELFYSHSSAPLEPSPFARHVVEQFAPSEPPTVLEVGCGNGRDAAYFAAEGWDVTAIDRSSAAIESCKAQHRGPRGLSFVQGTIDELSLSRSSFDVVYARFVLHAMALSEERSFLAAATRVLKPGGLALLECRSIHDPLAREGEVLSPTERIHGHYRRFIVPEGIATRVIDAGLGVETLGESSGLAKHAGEDPVVVRLIARKQSGN